MQPAPFPQLQSRDSDVELSMGMGQGIAGSAAPIVLYPTAAHALTYEPQSRLLSVCGQRHMQYDCGTSGMVEPKLAHEGPFHSTYEILPHPPNHTQRDAQFSFDSTGIGRGNGNGNGSPSGVVPFSLPVLGVAHGDTTSEIKRKFAHG